MAHILAKLKGVDVLDIKKMLMADAPKHAKDGLYLKHLSQDADDLKEVCFLFRTDDLRRARSLIGRVHTQAREKNPLVNLPHMAFLEEK